MGSERLFPLRPDEVSIFPGLLYGRIWCDPGRGALRFGVELARAGQPKARWFREDDLSRRTAVLGLLDSLKKADRTESGGPSGEGPPLQALGNGPVRGWDAFAYESRQGESEEAAVSVAGAECLPG